MNAINGLNLTGGTSVLSAQGGSFGDNPFLQLLITEMRNQTPLEPVDNANFMQQVAAFSSMEEQKELNDNMLRLLDFQGVLARLQGLSEGSALLGKVVTYQKGDKTMKGTVDSVFVNQEGEVRLRVGNDEIGMREISGIEQPKEGSEDSPADKDKSKESDKTNS
ncbi:MAG: flagellar hook capping FlgD N-terminal domain-containing protein [Planctomycetota bacterium]|jgi:flagellar basal-body rod modification protein FlgD